MTMSPYIAPGIRKGREYKMDEIVFIISLSTGITIYQMEGKSQTDDIVLARQLFFYFSRKLTGLAWRRIGNFLNRDHSTAIHGVNVIKNYLDTKDDQTCKAMQEIEKLLCGEKPEDIVNRI